MRRPYSTFFSAQKAILLAFLLLSITKVSAQNYYTDDHKFYGGLVLGTNLSQVDGDDYRGYDKAGLNAGAIVFSKIDDQLAWSMEILYSQKGSKSNGVQALEPGIYIQKYGVNLNYAEVPVMINYFIKGKSNFGGGLSYSRLASSSENLTEIGAATPNLNNYPFKKNDLNLILGGNVHLWQGLYFNLRFQYSMVSIRDKIPQNYVNAAQYNNMWVLRVMYLFF